MTHFPSLCHTTAIWQNVDQMKSAEPVPYLDGKLGSRSVCRCTVEPLFPGTREAVGSGQHRASLRKWYRIPILVRYVPYVYMSTNCTISVIFQYWSEISAGHEICTDSISPRASLLRHTAPATLPRLLGPSSGATGDNQAKERYESSTNCLCIAGRLNVNGAWNTVNCQTLTTFGMAIYIYILNQTPTKPPRNSYKLHSIVWDKYIYSDPNPFQTPPK